MAVTTFRDPQIDRIVRNVLDDLGPDVDNATVAAEVRSRITPEIREGINARFIEHMAEQVLNDMVADGELLVDEAGTHLTVGA